MRLSRKVVFALPSVLVAIGALVAYLCSDGETEPVQPAALPPTPSQPEVVDVQTPELPEMTTPAVAPQTQPVADNNAEAKATAPAVVLKTPEEYHAYFAKAAAELSGNAFWKKLIAEKDVLTVFIKAVEQLSCGNRPLALGDLKCMPIPAPFEAVETAAGPVIAPATEKRYSEVIDALASVQYDKARELLAIMEPELNRILHKDFGYPESTQFREMMTEALKVVLTTPVPDKPLALVKVAPHLYKYAIEELEKLPDAQKFVLRLGIENHAKVNDIAKALWQWSAAAK